jgi:hypothetical protein
VTRVRLTSEAAARFPDLANRLGTVLGTSGEGDEHRWTRVMWEKAGYAWVPTEDIEPVPEPEPPA